MKARARVKCPDCGAKAGRVSTSSRWRCVRCRASGTFLDGKSVVVMRYLTFSSARGWRLNPWHPQASMMTRLRARRDAAVVGA